MSEMAESRKLRSSVPELAPLSDAAVHGLWATYSEEEFCAGWLVMNDGSIREFREWLIKSKEPAHG